MKLNTTIVTLLIALVCAVQVECKEDKQPAFKSLTIASSQQLYDLYESNPDTIYLTAFYIQGNKHEEVLEQVETSLWSKKDIFKSVVYIPIDASDDYQFYGILYDLGILYESHEEYPFFLVIKDEEGQLVKGPKSAEIIKKNILDYSKA